MNTTADSDGGPVVDRGAVGSGIEADPEVRAEIERRLDVISAPDYVDPARRNFTALDWIVFAGFLAVCAIVFTAWGY